jgi:hypothetical protein
MVRGRIRDKVRKVGPFFGLCNLMGETWVMSQDIATLVSDWQGRDILAPMLTRKEVELVLYREVDQLMLFRSVNVPGILNLFMVTKGMQRLAAVTSAVQ